MERKDTMDKASCHLYQEKKVRISFVGLGSGQQLIQFESYIAAASLAAPFLLIPDPTVTGAVVVGARRAHVGLVAAGAAQPRPVAPVAPVGDGPAQQGADADVVHVVPVVLAPADGDHGGAK